MAKLNPDAALDTGNAGPWPRSRLQRWFFRRLPEDEGVVELHRGRIYILPTRYGYLFGIVIVLMIVGAMNYGTSLAFMMAFLLMSIGLISILYCFRNLHGLRLIVSPAEPVFAGQRAHFRVELSNPGSRKHFMIEVTSTDSARTADALPADTRVSLDLPVPAPKRGKLSIGPVRVTTIYPLGLVKGWTWLKSTAFTIVYPTPLVDGAALPTHALADGYGHSRTKDYEDFHGFRDYQPGDPLRHIAWRTLARGQPLQTKEFTGESGGDLWLRWNDTNEPNPERRLSQLCAWVLEADAAGLRYGLEIPGGSTPPHTGERHKHDCLERLAMY